MRAFLRPLCVGCRVAKRRADEPKQRGFRATAWMHEKRGRREAIAFADHATGTIPFLPNSAGRNVHPPGNGATIEKLTAPHQLISGELREVRNYVHSERGDIGAETLQAAKCVVV